ncbi:hypothetical protein KI387_024205, partial [Taxus chinensis]
ELFVRQRKYGMAHGGFAQHECYCKEGRTCAFTCWRDKACVCMGAGCAIGAWKSECSKEGQRTFGAQVQHL